MGYKIEPENGGGNVVNIMLDLQKTTKHNSLQLEVVKAYQVLTNTKRDPGKVSREVADWIMGLYREV